MKEKNREKLVLGKNNELTGLFLIEGEDENQFRI